MRSNPQHNQHQQLEGVKMISNVSATAFDEITRKALYNKSQQHFIESGYYLNKVEDWSYCISQDLYGVAKSLLGTNCSDVEILPAIYGDCSELIAIAKNRRVFWQISSEFCLRLTHFQTPEMALKRAIQEIRISHQRMLFDREAVISNGMTNMQIAEYISEGIVLFNRELKIIQPNPLYFTDEEIQRIRLKENSIVVEQKSK